MSIRLSCPSCNTEFVLSALPDSRRASCPRCGDVFPVRTYTEVAGDAVPPTHGEPEHASRTQGEGRRMVGVFAAALVLIALAGLPPFIVYYTRTKAKPHEPAATPTLTATPPAKLAALGHLRADCNLVFAVQPGPLLHYAARVKQEPRDVLAQAGLPDVLRGTVEQLGVPLTQIDHLAGGLSLGDGDDTLRLTLVMVLNQPLADEAEFLKRLKAKPVAGKKDRHDVMVGKFPLLLTHAAPTVWVFGLDDKDFDALGRGHGPGGEQFRDRVKKMIATAPSDAAVWAAADDERDWTQKPIVKLIGQSAEAKKWLPAVKDGRGGLLAVSLGEQPRLRLHVRTASDDTGARVRAYFAERAKETESATATGGDASAQFDAPFDANSGKLLQRFLSDAGR